MRYLCLFFVCFISFDAWAGEHTKSVAEYNDWKVYVQEENGEKVCFITSSPIKEDGNYNRRGEAHIWIRNINQKIDEVSVSAGYKYQRNTFPKVSLYGSKDLSKEKMSSLLSEAHNGRCTNAKENYNLDLIEDEVAWVQEEFLDAELIRLMKAKSYAIITATSTKNTCSSDIYSLVGFTKAYSHMKSLCAK